MTPYISNRKILQAYQKVCKSANKLLHESVFNPRPGTSVVLWDDYDLGDYDLDDDNGNSWRMFLENGIENLNGNGVYIVIDECERFSLVTPSDSGSPLFYDLREAIEAACSDWHSAQGFTITLDRGALEVYAHGPQQSGKTYTIIGLNEDGVNLLDDFCDGKGDGIMIDDFKDLVGSKYMVPITIGATEYKQALGESARDVSYLEKNFDKMEGLRKELVDIFHRDTGIVLGSSTLRERLRDACNQILGVLDAY